MLLDSTPPRSATAGDVTIDQLTDEQERAFVARQPRSHALHARALASLAGGVTSSWQITRPQPVFIARGHGSKIVDVDGNEYVDLHGGYGAGLAGHAHPAIVEAVTRQVREGTHFAQPNEDAIVVAEQLAGRFGLPLWRFTNSGTEATMDAVHLMRAVTGRDLIVKVEGCYHGHHDSAQVSVAPDEDDDLGPIEHPRSVAASSGIPAAITSLTLVATYNDLECVARLLEEHRGRVAGMIVEPIMMNAGIVSPAGGYLEGLRSLLHDHGALLCFDEVKTGLTVGPGGATGLFGVSPDIVCLAKSLGGGLITGAVGATAEVMTHVATGDYEMVGTFNGNPLSMAASRAVLEHVATEAAYDHIATLRARIGQAVTASIDRHGLPAHLVSIGAKGCVTFATSPVRNYRDFLRVDDRFNHLHWLVQHNHGVFLPPWGKTEQWMLSVQHGTDDADRFADNFERFAVAVGETLRAGSRLA
ncbi:MAG TPA: aspartate aminotransferase family protein [Acidimicrobiales bacterium]|nr:aspartate aminotransferase family protein [Acidimicrobiales bacterium]